MMASGGHLCPFASGYLIGARIGTVPRGRALTRMSWDHPNAMPLRLQVLQDFAAHSTPTGCVTQTPDPPPYLRLLPRPVAKAKPRT
jgi:hypothetical protein